MSAFSKFPKIAARNVSRNRRRSAVTLGAIVIGVAVLTILRGFIGGVGQLMVDDVVKSRSGAVQIHKRGYVDNIDGNPLEMNMPYSKEFMAKVRSVEGVTGVSGRLQFTGMVSNGRSQTMVVARGLDIEHEKEACPNSGSEVREGTALGTGDIGKPVALLGYELGQSFKATVPAEKAKKGADWVDFVNVQTSSPTGRTNALDLSVRGLTASNFPFENKRVLTVPLQTAQSLVGLEGRVTEYAVSVDDTDHADEIARKLQAVLGGEFEVHTWRELQPFVRDVINRQNFILGLIGFVLFVIVLTVIINTLLMTVFERVREIGTMLAVGVRRVQILWLFVLEAAVIGTIGGILGALVGRGVLLYFASPGIPMELPGTSATQLLVPRVSLQFVLASIVVALIGALIASIYPAWRASRMNPVDALRSL